MRRGERLAVYGVCTLALILSLRPGGWGGAAIAGSATLRIADEGRIATCDALAVTEALFSTDAYAPVRQSEETRLKSQLTPLEAALDALQKELQAADQTKPETQAKAQEFDTKRSEYFKLRQDLSDKYDAFVSLQFGEAYQRVQAAAKAVATDTGYTYVISQKSGAVAGPAPQTLIADLLGRPMLVKPEGSDITIKVREQLKLPATPDGSTGSEKPNPPATDSVAPGVKSDSRTSP